MPTPTNEHANQSSFQGPAAESEGPESQGVGIQAPAFSISSGDEGAQSNENQIEEDLEDLGGEVAIDDAFHDGFANDYRIAAEEFESSSSELGAFDLTKSDWSVAAPDHEYGKYIANELWDSIAVVVDAYEDGTEDSQEANREYAYKNLDLLMMSTDLQLSYVELFKAIQSKNLKPMLELFLKIYDAYNYVDLLAKLEKLHEDTAKLQKMMVDANKMLLKEGSDLMVDVLAIGLETAILAALGISNPILGGVIMLGLLYGTKAAKDSFIQVPESPGDPISTVLLTKTDEGLDLLAKGMEVSKDATDGFKDATGKIGKVKNGLGTVMGAAKTYKAYAQVQELEAFYNDYKKNAEELSKLYISDYAGKLEASGNAAKAIYNAGLEIGPTIDEALGDIQYYKNEIDSFESEK